MATRSRLGRGLGSLLSMTDTMTDDSNVATLPDPAERAPAAKPIVDRVPTSQIDVNPHQPRREFDDDALATLADSVKANGIIQPIVVRPTANGRHELIAGERRLRAAKLAGLKEVPVVVRDVDSYTQAQWALVENIQREDLNPIDRADAYAALLQQLGLTQAELAGRLGENRSSVANYLRLLDLDPTLRADVRNGELSFGHAKVLAGVTPAAEQLRLAALCKSQQLSVRNLERLIEAPAAAAKAADAAPADRPAGRLHLDEVEHKIVQQLGLRVQLRGGKRPGTGRVVIHYKSLEEFDDLMKRCGVEISDE